ncbi:alanyl-tRNA synthetase protein [Halorhabdus tiamatea SARL4B]|uniref:Alanyl-tRNA synthetase protein n=1 Tax=Halorhabdus tiamatea SARL4B TaxID=1033806 RepID=F7PH95_9EURY|nr:alanyl-tRNA editing protein [Halorhabdus tiamatea]ERJ05569.1 alanyl-tRNA synthetase protein [Halorhabdus tiamatea SARL4B]CCQ32514.1 threonyl/alanyl tRNA synthetase, SAD [Halorhabdus tiamatea SARL4B]
MTDLLYLPDEDAVTDFEATVVEASEDSIVLDGTYFYPEGGGQPADRGTIEWDGGQASVVDVRKDHGEIHHEIDDVEGDLPEDGETATGHVDADRREAHRRMHTAQHVLSRVVLDEYDATTAGNQIHADFSRIDFEPADFDDEDLELIEARTNDVIERNLPVTKDERPRETVEANVAEGRSNLDLLPDHVEELRVVEIDNFDMCPCGGTHVDRTGEIGGIEITNRLSKGADVERIEFELREN